MSSVLFGLSVCLISVNLRCVQVCIVVCDSVPEPDYIAGMACAYSRGELLLQSVAKQHSLSSWYASAMRPSTPAKQRM